MNRILRAMAVGALSLGLGAGHAAAQDYPSQSVRLVVPFSPGGSIDIVSRLIAPALSDELGQPVVVENHSGASGNVGAEYATRQEADGYTLLMHGLPFATQPALTANMPYEPLEDFTPVTVVAIQPNMLVVHPDLGVESVEELIAYAKEHPGELNFASSGPGATQHLATELLMDMADIDMVHVPYQGGGAAMTDLLGGRVQMMIETAPSAMRYAKSGEVVPLGVTTTSRMDAMPDLPTIAEAGVPGYELAGWIIMLAPTGTPDDVVDTVYSAMETVLAKPDVKGRLNDLGLIVDGRAPGEARTFLEGETKKYGELIRSVGITPN